MIEKLTLPASSIEEYDSNTDLTQLISILTKSSPREVPEIWDQGDTYQICLNLNRVNPEIGDFIISKNQRTRLWEHYSIPSLEINVWVNYLNQRIPNLTSNLLSILNGNEIELDTINLDLAQPFPSDYWNNWNEKRYYVENIYPLVIDTIKRIIGQDNSKKSITLVDICGGDGEFIELLSDSLHEDYPDSHNEYWLMDNNKRSIRMAKKKFAEREDVYIQEDDVTQSDIIPGGVKPKIVTIMGGLNHNVMLRGNAYNIAKVVYNKLNQGGFFIVTGYSPCLLNAEDFRTIGFNILNMIDPQSFTVKERPLQYYVLNRAI